MKNSPDKNIAASYVEYPEWPAVSDPIMLLHEKRPEIIKHIRKLAGYSEVFANSIFLSLVEITKKLKTMRLNKSMTYDFIKNSEASFFLREIFFAPLPVKSDGSGFYFFSRF